MTIVGFWQDAEAAYIRLMECRSVMYQAVKGAIIVVTDDPDTAAHLYSVRLDPQAGYLGLPFQCPAGLTCLTWRQDPKGYDGVEVIDFSEPWGDLPQPRAQPPCARRATT